MIRPEVQTALLRWREVLIACILAGVGLFVTLTRFGFTAWAGWLMVAVAVPIFVEGVRRARFPKGADGPGYVEVTERQIAYFGPYEGGSISIESIQRVTIQTRTRGSFLWQFDVDGGESLAIPGDAKGVEALQDALGVLPGADIDAATRAQTKGAPDIFLIWQGPSAKLHTRLH